MSGTARGAAALPAPSWWATGALAALGVLGFGGCDNDSSDLPRNSQTIDGVAIELGVLPSDLVLGHTMPSGAPSSTAAELPTHHIVVALFDTATGERITEAQVRAGVAAAHSSDHAPDRALEPMEIAGAMTYGGFFRMEGRGVYRIHLAIERPGTAQPIEAEFAYEHPSAY